jgi:hypothetical protein
MPRVGSTYICDSLNHFKNQKIVQEQGISSINLGEIFGRSFLKPMFDTSKFDENNIQIRDDDKFFTLSAPHRRTGEVRDSIGMSRKYSKIMLEQFMLINQRPYSLKIHIDHHKWIDNDRLKFVIHSRREDTTLCFLYRRDVEDMLLSWLIALETDIWNKKHLSSTKVKDKFYTDVIIDVEKSALVKVIHDTCIRIYNHHYNRSKEYHWDIIICYEDLTGDPVVDFQPYFDYPITSIETRVTNKLLTKAEKISMIKDYPAFKKLLLQKLNELNMPLFLDRI